MSWLDLQLYCSSVNVCQRWSLKFFLRLFLARGTFRWLFSWFVAAILDLFGTIFLIILIKRSGKSITWFIIHLWHLIVHAFPIFRCRYYFYPFQTTSGSNIGWMSPARLNHYCLRCVYRGEHIWLVDLLVIFRSIWRHNNGCGPPFCLIFILMLGFLNKLLHISTVLQSVFYFLYFLFQLLLVVSHER